MNANIRGVEFFCLLGVERCLPYKAQSGSSDEAYMKAAGAANEWQGHGHIATN